MPIVADPAAYCAEDIFHIYLPKLNWRAVGLSLGNGAHSRCHLNATVQIAGADHHLEAIEVTEIEGQQTGINGAEDRFEALLAFRDGGDGPFETVSIEGRTYVLSMIPFAR